MSRFVRSLLCVGICSISFLVAAPVTAAMSCYYFESVGNCGGSGGWIVLTENPDESATITILCDGGGVG